MLRKFLLSAVIALPSQALAASIVTDWLDVAIPAANVATSEPTAAARFYNILFTAMYDAWSAYDDRAVATVTGGALRGEGGAATDVNRREAISHAAYQVVLRLAPVNIRFARDFMQREGYDPDAMTPPAILGRKMAQTLLHLRMDDGANEEGGYLDTGDWMYEDPSVLTAWQPVSADTMETELQVPITPHWGGLPPFAIGTGSAFRPPPPPQPDTPEWDDQIAAVLDYSAHLDDERKAIAEYWNNFISHPPSHLVTLTKFVSLRDDMRLDADIAMFFAVGNALYDTSIAAWDAKYHYDYLRPVNAIRRLDGKVLAWDNPNHTIPLDKLSNDGQALDWGRERGTVVMDAAQWYPYLPTPPFPSYISGHSAFTEAWAETMRKVTGSDQFGFTAEWPKLFVENRWLNQPVKLTFATFEDAALSSGISRIYGGIHWPVDDAHGREMGGAVAQKVWDRTVSYLNGQAHPLMEPMIALDRGGWSHRTSGEGQASFASDSNLSITLDPAPNAHLAARWQTGPLDPMAAGTYEFVAMVERPAGAAGEWTLALENASGATQALAMATGKPGETVARFTVELDGSTPLRLVFAAQSEGEPAAFRLLELGCRRIAPESL